MPRPVRLMTLAPGHFHAALVHKFAHPDVHERVHVYAPLGDELVDYVQRLVAFNDRADRPTGWKLDVRAGDDFLDRFRRELPGHAAVLAGRNRTKIDHLLAAVTAPCPVLADKPWVVSSADLPKLAEVLEQADLRDVPVWDVMTERHEITCALLRELVNDGEVFGNLLAGTPDEPAVTLDSTHHLKKTVSGVPLRRPAWWFDPDEAGVGLADVGTHLVDLAMWVLFPDQSLDHRHDVTVLDASVWPTPLSREQFKVCTGLRRFPDELHERIGSGELLLYQANGTATFALRGAHVRVTTGWDFEAPAGQGDTLEAVAHGSFAKLSVKPAPGPDGRYRQELFVAPNRPADLTELTGLLRRRVDEWACRYPGMEVEERGPHLRVHIPDEHRTDHEQHFADVLSEFLYHLRHPRQAPPWERTNIYTKYFITTTAVDLAKKKQSSRC